MKTHYWFGLPGVFRTALGKIVSFQMKNEYLFKRMYPYYALNFLSQKDLYLASLDLTKSAMTDEELNGFLPATWI